MNSGDLDAVQVPHAETWRALEGCVDGGLATHIGVSNFNEPQLQALLDVCTVRPAVNQIELHPYNASPALCAYCAEQGVLLTSYCVLGHGSGAGVPLLESPVVAAIAERRGMTPAQVLIRFQTERGAARRRRRPRRGSEIRIGGAGADHREAGRTGGADQREEPRAGAVGRV